MHVIFGILLILHGVITLAISGGTFAPTADIPNPRWLGWWPTQLGTSWIPGLGWLGGATWLVAGILLLGAGLGFFGFQIPVSWWVPLAICGAIVGLIALVLYFHPYYVPAVIINGVVLWIGLALALNPDSWWAGFLKVAGA